MEEYGITPSSMPSRNYRMQVQKWWLLCSKGMTRCFHIKLLPLAIMVLGSLLVATYYGTHTTKNVGCSAKMKSNANSEDREKREEMGYQECWLLCKSKHKSMAVLSEDKKREPSKKFLWQSYGKIHIWSYQTIRYDQTRSLDLRFRNHTRTDTFVLWSDTIRLWSCLRSCSFWQDLTQPDINLVMNNSNS